MDEMSPAGAPHDRLIAFVTDRPGHDFRYAIDATQDPRRARLAAVGDPRRGPASGPCAGISTTATWWQAIQARGHRLERLGLEQGQGLMRALVFGETGQVARELALTAADPGVAARFLGRAAADLPTPRPASARSRAADADVVVNAAAYTAVDRAEDEPDLARTVNATAPGAMAVAAAAEGRAVPPRLDRLRLRRARPAGRGARPTRPARSASTARRSAPARRRSRAATPDHVILRTAWVFSAHGANFVKTMLRVGRGKPEMRVVGDQRGGPTAARDIADALWTIAEAWRDGRGDAGVFHYAGAPACTWADFAEAIFAASGWDERPARDPDRHRRLADAGACGRRTRCSTARGSPRPTASSSPTGARALAAVVAELAGAEA